MSAPTTTADRVRTHLVIGERDQVRAALARAYADGWLVDVRGLVALPGDRVQLTADLCEPASRNRRRWPWLVLAWLLAAAAAAGVVWLLVLAVAAVTAAVAAALAWLSAHLPVLVLAAVALLLVFSAGSRCGGLHCGGCRG